MDFNRQRLLLFGIRGLGIFSFIILLVAKCPYARVLNSLCVDDMVYGNTYRDAKLRPFKVRLPDPVGDVPAISDPKRPGAHRLFFIGDCASQAHYGMKALVLQLSERLREPIYYDHLDDLLNPACLFQEEAPHSQAPGRVLVVDSVEFALVRRLSKSRPCPAPVSAKARPFESWAPVVWSNKIINVLFLDIERRLHFLLTNSKLTAPFVESWNTALFARFCLLPASEPMVSLAPPFLFSSTETSPILSSSFYAPHDDALVLTIAKNLEEISNTLRSQYNVELIFLPVPNKFTIYHRFVTADRYDNFLPRLDEELRRRGVRTVRLYEPFLRSQEFVYHPSDSNWNRYGASITLEEVVRAIEEARR